MVVGVRPCPNCGTGIPAETWAEGVCPQCLLELALEDSSLEARVGVDPQDAPTLQFSAGGFAEGEVQGERYRIRSLLGRGGMGEVWRAYDLKLRQDVALKALRTELVEDGQALEMLRQEVRTAREVISPNVCRVFDLQEVDNRELISMEYVDGTTLQAILEERSPLELDEARGIASQFLAGLEAIHAAGLIHRDIKPENIMLTRTGRVVVMDFGIANALESGKGGRIAGTPAYMSPEQQRGEQLDARSDVFAAGVVLAEMVEPGGVGSLEDRQLLWEAIHRDPPEVKDSPWQKVLARAVSAETRDRFESAAALARALEEVTLRAAGDETARPYPGLFAFQQEDANFFFGRELEVEALLKKLRRPHLMAVIGPSGAGKSSFLRAGLLPTLTDGWQVIVITPGSRPFAHLSQALSAHLGEAAGVTDLLARIEEPGVAVELLGQWRRGCRHALLVVDQFEELFTQNSEETQQRFADLLGQLPLEADVHVLLSMRDDFLHRCSELESLAPVFSELSPLKSLSGASLRRALVEPALKCGYRFEDEVIVEEMLAEVEGERGALPMVAFAAAQLWERRDREAGLLTRKAYEQIGGVGGALAQHAEAILDYIGEANVPIVRELFRNLVTAQGTRASRNREELLSVFSESEGEPILEPSRVRPTPVPKPRRPAAGHVLNTLIDARLLTSYEIPAAHDEEPNQQRIEIVHESLLSAWPRLVRWQRQDAYSAQLRDELRAQAQLWDQHGRSVDYLWTGTAYREFQLWRERYPGGLTSLEEAYAQAMTAHAERQRRRRRIAAAAAFLVLLAVLGVVSGFWLRSVAEARRAEAAKLVAIAQLREEEDPTEALAYTTASLELADSDEARLFALKLLWEVPPALEVVSEESAVRVPQFSPEGSRLAAFGYSENVWVFGETGEPPVALPGHGSGAEPVSAFWATDELLVTMDPEPTSRAYLWRLPEGERLRAIELDSPVTTSDLETGSGLLLVRELVERPTDTFGRLRSWRLPAGEPEELGTLEPGAVAGGFEPSGPRWVYGSGREIFSRELPLEEGAAVRLVGSHENEAHLFRPSRPDRLWTCDRVTSELHLWDLSRPSGGPLRAVAPPDGIHWCDGWESPNDPSGRWAVDSHHPQQQHTPVWDLGAWPKARPFLLRRSGSWGGSYTAFHPRGEWLVASTHARSHLTFWPLRNERPRVVDGYEMIFRPLAFSPDGEWLATGWRDLEGSEPDEVRLWPLPGSGTRTPRSLPLPEQIGWGGLAFDPGGRFVFVTGKGDRAYVVPLDGSPPRRLEGFSDGTWLLAAAVSPSGRQVVTAFGLGPAGSAAQGQGTLRVWSLETGQVRLLELPEVARASASGGWEAGVHALAFGGESTLFTAGAGGVHRWDLVSGTHELVYERPGCETWMVQTEDHRAALVLDRCQREFEGPTKLLDLVTGESQDLPAFDQVAGRLVPVALDRSGAVVAASDSEGRVRVGRLSGAPAHLLVGHQGPVDSVAISPDGRWIASSGEDNTLRLWPMPDLDKPPLHTLPREELIAKLETLTNLRAVRDETSSAGWSIEIGPFPGWAEVPEW